MYMNIDLHVACCMLYLCTWPVARFWLVFVFKSNSQSQIANHANMHTQTQHQHGHGHSHGHGPVSILQLKTKNQGGMLLRSPCIQNVGASCG